MTTLDARGLLPCPFCGGTDIRTGLKLSNNHEEVWCDDCSAQISHDAMAVDARAAWNRRAYLAAVAEPVGWAYQDKRWDNDRWHVCGLDSKPREHEGRIVASVYLAPIPVSITDEMVERAARAYAEREFGTGCPVWEEDIAKMRAALEAAHTGGKE